MENTQAPTSIRAYIYALIDPCSEKVFYVGKTVQPLYRRLNEHIQETKRVAKNSPRSQFIREILALRKKPLIRLLEEVDEADWREAEVRWAAYFTDGGTALLNVPCQLGNGGTRSYIIELSPDIEARLGIVADAVLAEELGVTRKAIAYHRGVRKIAASHNRTRNTPPPHGRPFESKLIPESTLRCLGLRPDYVLAAEIGVSKKLIARRRKALGIPSYAEQTGNRGTYQKGNYPARWLKP